MGYFDIRIRSHISVVFISMHDDRQAKKPNLYAQINYKDNLSVCVELEYWTQSGHLDEHNFKEFWVAYVLRNKHAILSMEAPVMAKISTNALCNTSMPIIPIQGNTTDKNLTYGICLHQPLYNIKDPQLLVDWVELNLALGADIITVYIQNVSESFYTIMLPYIEKGAVEVIDWKLKPPLIDGYTKCWGQVGTINECIYRSVYRVTYLALIDIDEFIVPQQTLTVTKMLRELEIIKPKASSFTFLNTLFFQDGVSLPEVKLSVKCRKMSWPRYFTFTLQCANPEIEAKTMTWHKIVVKPKAVIGAWVHNPTKVLPGYDNTYYAPVNVGLTYHYRGPNSNRVQSCESKEKPQKKRVFTISRYFNQTLMGIQEALC